MEEEGRVSADLAVGAGALVAVSFGHGGGDGKLVRLEDVKIRGAM